MEKQCWHPVLYSRELKDTPRSVKLCDECIVIWRTPNGEVKALRDLCIHRGTALSLGSVCNGEVVCPYHGWRFDGSGKCTLIPQLTDQSKIPPKARVESYLCCEQYGLIWIALKEPRYLLPNVPELLASEWSVVETGPFRWRSSSSRQVENFTDFAHFPFVHPGLLGDPERPLVPQHTVVNEGNVLRYEIIRPEAKNLDEFPIFANPSQDQPTRHSRYELYLPYTIIVRIAWKNTGDQMIYFFASQPVSTNECIGYCIIGKNYGERDEKTLCNFEEVIFDQDKRIVESQRPEQVPFDLAAELHLKFDAVAVAYRKAMQELGFSTDLKLPRSPDKTLPLT